MCVCVCVYKSVCICHTTPTQSNNSMFHFPVLFDNNSVKLTSFTLFKRSLDNRSSITEVK